MSLGVYIQSFLILCCIAKAKEVMEMFHQRNNHRSHIFIVLLVTMVLSIVLICYQLGIYFSSHYDFAIDLRFLQ